MSPSYCIGGSQKTVWVAAEARLVPGSQRNKDKIGLSMKVMIFQALMFCGNECF